MRTIINAVLLVAILITGACSPVYHYQVFNNKSADEKNIISFENDEIRIEYDFWEDDGQLEISVLNKTGAPLFLDLTQSGLVVNDTVFRVYRDMETSWANSFSRSKSVGYLNWYGFYESPGYTKGVSYGYAVRSNPIVYVPAKSIANLLLRDQLPIQKYNGPDAKLKRRESNKSLYFNKEKSPNKFRFNLSYSTDKDMLQIKQVDDEFWVESISIMNEKEFEGKIIGRDPRTGKYKYSYPHKKNNAFYVRYQVGGLED